MQVCVKSHAQETSFLDFQNTRFDKSAYTRQAIFLRNYRFSILYGFVIQENPGWEV